MNLAAASFTFHYVSILIALYQLTPKCGTDFTFHYVSILIGLHILRRHVLSSLHSIMSLF